MHIIIMWRVQAPLGFNRNVQRASIVGLGCAGAVPTLQRAADFVRANPSRKALMLAVKIYSACYYIDNSLETVVGNAIYADGAAAHFSGLTSSVDIGGGEGECLVSILALHPDMTGIVSIYQPASLPWASRK